MWSDMSVAVVMNMLRNEVSNQLNKLTCGRKSTYSDKNSPTTSLISSRISNTISGVGKSSNFKFNDKSGVIMAIAPRRRCV
jgi:hypothetical protein